MVARCTWDFWCADDFTESKKKQLSRAISLPARGLNGSQRRGKDIATRWLRATMKGRDVAEGTSKRLLPTRPQNSA
jgi:hypothetical protein